jgi:hypothetical protein
MAWFDHSTYARRLLPKRNIAFDRDEAFRHRAAQGS